MGLRKRKWVKPHLKQVPQPLKSLNRTKRRIPLKIKKKKHKIYRKKKKMKQRKVSAKA